MSTLELVEIVSSYNIFFSMLIILYILGSDKPGQNELHSTHSHTVDGDLSS